MATLLPCQIVLICALGISCTLAQTSWAAVYQPPHAEPTAEEVAILDLMNRFRADPVGEADRISHASDLPGFFWRGVDKTMFNSEMKALTPVPPLVFDLQALLSARQHSHYMVINNTLTHVQKAGSPGFTGKSFSDRMKVAKFKGSPGGENAFKDAGNAWQSHAGFIIDFGPGGPGGMQKGRGHRRNMISGTFNVVGPSAVPHSNRFSVVHNFGKVKGRFVGGVIYSDKNTNGVFDPGEQFSHVQIGLEKAKKTTMTWASGGYVLPINSSTDTLIIKVGEMINKVPLTAGADNIRVSWAVPPEHARKAADALLAKVNKIEDNERNTKKRRAALVNLYMGARTLDLDAERKATIEALTEEIAAELTAAQQTYLNAISTNDKRELSQLKRGFKDWRSTAAYDWFRQAEILSKANKGVEGFRKTKEAGREIDKKNREKLVEALTEAKSKTSFDDLQARYTELINEVSGGR